MKLTVERSTQLCGEQIGNAAALPRYGLGRPSAGSWEQAGSRHGVRAAQPEGSHPAGALSTPCK